ncbi:MAG: RNA-binding protein [Actinobacteria bacterium]|nr:RNA-binding protein [Actinomycetota bacterium]
MATKLYVGNLSYNVTEDQLRELFSEVGKVDSVNLITDQHSGQSKGFAFVEMSNEDEAKAAIENLNGKEVDSRTLNVNVARPREERGGSRGGYGRGGGGGGGRQRQQRY